jgi:hypothetical protein
MQFDWDSEQFRCGLHDHHLQRTWVEAFVIRTRPRTGDRVTHRGKPNPTGHCFLRCTKQIAGG